MLPKPAGAVWLGGRAARRNSSALLIRALGARDAAIGLGTIVALARRDRESARLWFAAQLAADGVDVGATVAACGKVAGAGVPAVAIAAAAADLLLTATGGGAMEESSG